MVRCWEREATVLQQLPMGGGKWDTKKTAAGGAKQGQGRVENEAMHNRTWKVCVRASRAGCGQGTTLHPPPHFNSGMAKINHFWPGTRLRVGKNSPQIDPKCEFWNVFVQNFEKKLFSKQFLTFFREPSGLVQASLAGGGVRGQEKSQSHLKQWHAHLKLQHPPYTESWTFKNTNNPKKQGSWSVFWTFLVLDS